MLRHPYLYIVHNIESPTTHTSTFLQKEAKEAINSLTNPRDKEYFVNVLYFVSDPKSPLNPIIFSNKYGIKRNGAAG